MTQTLEAPANTAGGVYREALEQVCATNRAYAALVRSRINANHANAARYEARTGRLAHKDRAAAAEAEYLLQQFERIAQ